MLLPADITKAVETSTTGRIFISQKKCTFNSSLYIFILASRLFFVCLFVVVVAVFVSLFFKWITWHWPCKENKIHTKTTLILRRWRRTLWIRVFYSHTHTHMHTPTLSLTASKTDFIICRLKNNFKILPSTSYNTVHPICHHAHIPLFHTHTHTHTHTHAHTPYFLYINVAYRL